MNSRTTARLRETFAELSQSIQRQVRRAYRRFKDNPYHPGLPFKRVHATDPIYSVRINTDYRALGVLDGDEIVWFWIGSHAEYDKLLTKMR